MDAMSERLPVSGGDDQRIPEDDLQSLVGRTIVAVEHVEEATGSFSYGRTDGLKLTLDDGRVAAINHWATYADDSGLDLEIEGAE